MKKIILAAFFFSVLPMTSHGAGYVLANYATGGKVHESSYGIEMGAIFLSPYHPNGGAFSLGVGLSIAQTDENPSLDYSGRYNDGNEQEICATFGAEIVPAFFGVAGLGYASQDTLTRVSGTSSKTGTGTDNHGTFMLGMRYVVTWFNIGLGYDLRRGIMASLGAAF